MSDEKRKMLSEFYRSILSISANRDDVRRIQKMKTTLFYRYSDLMNDLLVPYGNDLQLFKKSVHVFSPSYKELYNCYES